MTMLFLMIPIYKLSGKKIYSVKLFHKLTMLWKFNFLSDIYPNAFSVADSFHQSETKLHEVSLMSPSYPKSLW